MYGSASTTSVLYLTSLSHLPWLLGLAQRLLLLFLCSRNQLSTIPPFICQLQCLEVLLAANNKLVSLPEEIGGLSRLMDMVGYVVRSTTQQILIYLLTFLLFDAKIMHSKEKDWALRLHAFILLYCECQDFALITHELQ